MTIRATRAAHSDPVSGGLRGLIPPVKANTSYRSGDDMLSEGDVGAIRDERWGGDFGKPTYPISEKKSAMLLERGAYPVRTTRKAPRS